MSKELLSSFERDLSDMLGRDGIQVGSAPSFLASPPRSDFGAAMMTPDSGHHELAPDVFMGDPAFLLGSLPVEHSLATAHSSGSTAGRNSAQEWKAALRSPAMDIRPPAAAPVGRMTELPFGYPPASFQSGSLPSGPPPSKPASFMTMAAAGMPLPFSTSAPTLDSPLMEAMKSGRELPRGASGSRRERSTGGASTSRLAVSLSRMDIAPPPMPPSDDDDEGARKPRRAAGGRKRKRVSPATRGGDADGSPGVKKQSHNEIERKRRLNINESLQALQDALQDGSMSVFQKRRPSKAIILASAVTHIRQQRGDLLAMAAYAKSLFDLLAAAGVSDLPRPPVIGLAAAPVAGPAALDGDGSSEAESSGGELEGEAQGEAQVEDEDDNLHLRRKRQTRSYLQS